MKKVIAAAIAVATNVVCAALPAEYQQLEYIQASGNCRIKTGLTPAWNDKVEMTWQPTTVSGNQALVFARRRQVVVHGVYDRRHGALRSQRQGEHVRHRIRCQCALLNRRRLRRVRLYDLE